MLKCSKLTPAVLQSGVYKVRGDESGAGAGTMRLFPATVVFLDDSSHRFTLDKKAKGQDLLTAVFQHLELTEREYFGLVWSEGGAALPPGHARDVTRWLDPAKPVRKQMRVKGMAAITLYFRLKFYVTDPSRLQEEYTRYHAYLQVKISLLNVLDPRYAGLVELCATKLKSII